jgi:hypothetical protein
MPYMCPVNVGWESLKSENGNIAFELYRIVDGVSREDQGSAMLLDALVVRQFKRMRSASYLIENKEKTWLNVQLIRGLSSLHAVPLNLVYPGTYKENKHI